MKICLIGGIYGTSGHASGYLRVTPETTLEAGLRRAGHEVTTMSHYAEADFERFDVVHVHHLSYGALRLACDKSMTPFVFTPHDASQMSGIPLGRVRAQALAYVHSRADRVVALSRAEARFLEHHAGVQAERLASIPNGIDTSLFPFVRRNNAGHDRPWQLLFVGQLIPLKRCEWILRAMADLGTRVELSLVYQAADLESELKVLAAELKIDARVHFVGKQEPSQLAEFYQRSDILVLASETEALPSVISEAMLSGLPFVATSVGGIPEQAHGFGHLVESSSCAALANGIQHVLDRYKHYQRRSSAMSTHARSTYSIDEMVSHHIQAYEEIVGRAARRHQLGYWFANALTRVAVHTVGTRGASRTHPSKSDQAPHRQTTVAERS